jgi:hypothetical protein
VSVYKKLDPLNIALPERKPPVAALVPFLRSGNLPFSSGHIAKINGKTTGRPAWGESHDGTG